MALASLLAACADLGDSAPPLPEELQPLQGATKLSDLDRAEEVSAVGKIGLQTYLETPTGLWFTNGTAASTRRVHQGGVKALAVINSVLFYSDASALWKIGESGLAFKVIDLPGMATAGAAMAVLGPQHLAFLAPGADQHQHLWISDGSAAGTLLTSVVDPTELKGIGNLAFFGAKDPLNPAAGEELWASDGTVEGTRLVKDLHATGSSSPHGFTAWPAIVLEPDRANVLFAASGEGTGTELWRSDGTSAGTFQLGDINPGPESSDPRDLFIISPDRALFSAISSAGGKRELWSAGFTPQSTAIVHEVEPMGPMVFSGTALARGAFFAGRDDATGIELWKTDGTRAKTSRVFDLAPGPLSSTPTGLHYVQQRGPLVFTAEYPTSGGSQLMMLAEGSTTPEVLATLTTPLAPRPPRALAALDRVLLVFADAGDGPALWGVDLTLVLPPPPPPPPYNPDDERSCSAGRGAGGPFALAVLSLLLLGRGRRRAYR